MIDFISKPISDSIVVVQVTGRLAELERDYFFDCVGDLLEAGYSNVIVECTGLGAVSSSGSSGLVEGS